jgi:uncharacterized protein (DUF305 family)
VRRPALVAAVAILATGCGGNDAATTTVTGYRFFDHAYIDALVAHHRASIELAQKAKGNGLSEPELIQIADALLLRQQQEIDQVEVWRGQWFGSEAVRPGEDPLAVLGLTPEQAGTAPGEDIWDALDTNKAFAGMMSERHRGAIRLAELVADKGEHFELQDFSEEMARVAEVELTVLEQYAD